MSNRYLIGKAYTEYFRLLKIQLLELRNLETTVIREKRLIITKVFDAYVVHYSWKIDNNEPHFDRTFTNIDSIMRYLKNTAMYRVY